MYAITGLAIFMWVISFTVFFCGIAYKNETGKDDMIGTGLCMLAVCIVSTLSFDVGAFWQRDDTLKNYDLLPKVHNTPPKP